MKDISRTLFLVDGITEIRAFREKFLKDFKVAPSMRKVDCNGKSVTPDGYAAKALPIIQMGASGQFSTFFCVIDLETRQQLPMAFGKCIANTITRCLTARRISVDIAVAVPNRMFENWNVSDIEGLKIAPTQIKAEAEQHNYDGKNGVSVLKRIMSEPYR